MGEAPTHTLTWYERRDGCGAASSSYSRNLQKLIEVRAGISTAQTTSRESSLFQKQAQMISSKADFTNPEAAVPEF